MGLDLLAANFLVGEVRRGTDFSKTLTLGRQEIHMSPASYRSVCSNLQVEVPAVASFADEFFAGLGAKTYKVLDASPYEGAGLVHDLNLPIPDSFPKQWSCVFDGGTLEHVFNFPQAIKNCMDLVSVGGHFISITPWNNWGGHGFYQFSPELFYRVLSDENGFKVERMLMNQGGKWFLIKDPRTLGYRVETYDCRPTLVYLSARRLTLRPIFSKWPQQSDYAKAWSPAAPTHGDSADSKSPQRFLSGNQSLFWDFLRALWRRQKSRHHQRIRQSLWAQRWPERQGAPI